MPDNRAKSSLGRSGGAIDHGGLGSEPARFSLNENRLLGVNSSHLSIQPMAAASRVIKTLLTVIKHPQISRAVVGDLSRHFVHA